ncbi:tyrosine-type recombinase/integrase [Luteitalea sp.]|uniref:tyrosine-type recombinase/integrase n=1 Tax=Luteitalea sp. TaxID=2004800 RepID=UPI0025BFF85A|nr:tyrosine-type recombinase/integrase [Luteitalea sp.]
MTVYRAKDRRTKNDQGKLVAAYRYDFWYRGVRHVSPRPYPSKREAADAEAARRRTLRRLAAGLEVARDETSPAIADWAETYMDHVERRGKLTDPASAEHVLRVVLRFWGRRPDRPLEAHETGPYHDLCLADPIDTPAHLLAFEEWMLARGVAGATRNRYRTAMSRLYQMAMLPEYRAATGVTMNPFRALERDPVRRRTVTITPEQLRAVMLASPAHLRLAIAIAALAPKLRLGNILALRWDEHISPDLRLIRVEQHKTARSTGRPLITPVSDKLHGILAAAKARQPKGVSWVVHYLGDRVKTIDTGLIASCKAAGVPYGLKAGVTFHTLRHTAATKLAALGVPEGIRKDVMGHTSIQTTQWYTHLEPRHEVAPLNQLAEVTDIAELVFGAGGDAGGTDPASGRSDGSPRVRMRRRQSPAKRGESDASGANRSTRKKAR